MRLFLLFTFITSSIYLQGQETWWKNIDLTEGFDVPWDVKVINDTVYIWAQGGSESASWQHYYKMDFDGNILYSKDIPDLRRCVRVGTDENYFYSARNMRSDTTYDDDGFRVSQFDFNANLIKSRKYSLEDFPHVRQYPGDFYFGYGCIKYNDKVVLYGEIVDTTTHIDDSIWRSAMMWLDENLEPDTLIYIQPGTDPAEEIIDTWDAKVDANGNLTLLIEQRLPPADEFSRPRIFLRYVKYNQEGHFLSIWNGPQWLDHSRLHCPMDISEDNEHLLYTESEVTNSLDIMLVEASGEIRWRETLDQKQVDFDNRSLLDLKFTKEGDVIGCGQHSGAIADLQGAYLFKLDGQTGEMLWERTYQDWRDTLISGTNSVSQFLIEIDELSDGTLLVLGESSPLVIDPDGPGLRPKSQFIIMRLDEDGCLEPGCGGTKQNLIGEPAYDGMLTNEALWYYRKFDSPQGILKKWTWSFFPDRHLDINAVEFLHPRDEGHFDGDTPEIYRTEQEGRLVYYTADGRNDLLYDFTLEVGDIFESSYIDQPLEVIESDTMRLSNRAKMRYWVLACTENPENKITWMERIGTYHGIVWPQDFCSGDYGDLTLTCYYKYERLAHMNPDVGGCFLPSSTDDLSYEQLDAITLFPNPTSSRLTISSPELGIQRVDILDVSGQTESVHYDNVREIQYDLQGYVPGLYFFSVHTEKGQVVKKVVVE